MFRNIIKNAIIKESGIDDINLEYPADIVNGDYSTNIALINAKKENLNPREYAQNLVEKLLNNANLSKIVSKIEVAGPGFINFYLSEKALADNLTSISKHQADNNKKLMLEFAHPNTHKAFHIGHLLNIVTGEALARIWAEVGHEVIRVNYQGDVGMHIAKAIYGLMQSDFKDPGDNVERAKLLAKAYVEGNKAFENNEPAKNEIIEINKSIYKKDREDINKLYKETRQWSLDYFDDVYARLGTKYDRFYFESEVFETGIAKINEALEKGILEESDGAVVYKGEKDGLHTRVFLTAEGNPTYEGKELGLAKFQLEEYHPDKIIHLVGKEQSGYFEVTFKVIEQLYPNLANKEYHQTYGWVSLKGGKMSSRKGNVILGMWLLDEVKDRIKSEYEDVNDKAAEQIAQAAVKYAFLKNNIQQDIAFDLDESISMAGNSGPYLQYSVVRAKSVLDKSELNPTEINNLENPKISDVESDLTRRLSRFDEIIIDAANNYSPSTLATYLYELASEFNKFYNGNKIIGDDNQDLRILLTRKFVEVEEKGLQLLGIQVPEKM